MVKQQAICVGVVNGDTLETDSKLQIRLARVCVPEIEKIEGIRARNMLMSMIDRREINYEVVGPDKHGGCVCEVWVDNANVNDWMISLGYGKSQ